MPNEARDLDALHRDALHALDVFEPPPGFADRVVAEATRQERPAITAPPTDAAAGPSAPRLRRWIVGVAAAAAVAVSAAAAASWLSRPQIGEVSVQPGLSEGTGPQADVPISRRAPTGGERGTIPADIDRRIDDYVAGYGRLYGDAFRFHGSIVVLHEGEVVFARGYGDARRVEWNAGTGVVAHGADVRTPIGTLTQQITAVAVLRLVDRGAIDLDAPIRRYLPDYPEGGDRITVRHLLVHASGIPNFTDDPDYRLWRGERSDTAGLLARFSGMPLEFEPGTDFDPSSSGYAVLGAILEAVSGQRYADFVAAEIFAPAGMTQSTVGEPAPGVQSAEGYLFNEEEELRPIRRDRLDLASTGAAGSIVSTPLDLARFVDAALRGRLLGAETRDAMLTPTGAESYGLGWIISRDRGQKTVGHPGGTDGINGAIRYYSDDHTVILAIANSDVIDCRAVLDDLSALVHGGRPQAPREYEETPVDVSRLDIFAGHYVLSKESRERLDAIYDLEEVDRMAEADVLRTGDRLTFYVPGHGSKWMHGYGVDTFFFKDASGTVASFTIPEGATKASKVTLHQGRLEIVLEREAEAEASAKATGE
ncbi:MAG: serine hydrolase domain-containing protein [Nannocystaceae bacterium]